MIVDAHAHLGYDHVFDKDFLATELLDAQAANGIDATLVQPGTAHDLDTVRQQHDAIAELARRYPGRFYGIANPNPHLPDADYAAEVARCVETLGFVGIKLHPLAHAVNPLGRSGRRLFALAADRGLPVMVHTGVGLPWAAPALLDRVCREHPTMRIVVAHAGGGICAAEAFELAARHPNVTLEGSWAAGHFLQHAIAELGADRVVFGSDHAENVPIELAKYRGLGLDAARLALVLGGNARRVFGLPG